MQHGELRSDRGSWFINEFFLKLAFFNISMTPSKQEIDHPTSSSSSSTSPPMTPTTVRSESVAKQERRDLCGIDSYPAAVSSKHFERQERGDLCHSDKLEWLQEFIEKLVDDRVLEHRLSRQFLS